MNKSQKGKTPMSLKLRFISLIIALMTCLSLVSCNNSGDTPDDDDTPDDFSGSISDGNDDEDEDNTEEKPEDAGDPDSITTITTAEQLRAMKRKGTYILGADIDLGGASWTPVGTYGAPFEGTFDGAGHKITGLKIDTAEADLGISLSYSYLYYGFFGVTKGATVKDVKFDTVAVNASASDNYCMVYAGIVSGLSIDTSIENCTVSGSITAVSTNSIAIAGAVTAMTDNSSIKNCVSNANIKTERSAVRAVSGGIVGHARPGTRLTDCSTNSSIYASSTIGVAYAGGIAGYIHTSELTRCASNSEVYAEVSLSSPESGAKGAAHAGGIAAVSTANDEKNMSVLTKCCSTKAKVSAVSVENAVYACGIVTDSDYTKLIDCYSYAQLEADSVNESAYSGGLMGVITKDCVIERSFFAGSIKADASVETDGSNEANITVGTVSCSEFSKKEDSDKVFVSANYRADTQFTLNGVTYTKGQSKNIIAQGTSRQSNIFSNLSLLCESLGWSVNEWEIKDGIVTFKK